MKENKIDLRILKTRKNIEECFLQLIKEKEYEKITVADITRKALINRNTFYLHYKNKEDLMEKISLSKIDAYKDLINEGIQQVIFTNRDPQVLEDSFKQFFNIIEKDRPFYELVISNRDLYIYFVDLMRYVKRKIENSVNMNRKQLIVFEYVFNGISGLIQEWLEEKISDTNELSHLLSRFILTDYSQIIE